MASFKIVGSGDYELEVVGESYYQKNFEKICGPRKPKGVNLFMDASLMTEANPHDENAIRVEIQGRQVGYLPRETARDYVALLKALKIPMNTVLVVPANIRGGWKDGRDVGHYGVWLDFPTDEKGASQLKAIAEGTGNIGRQSSTKLPFSCLILAGIGLLVFCLVAVVGLI